MSSRPRLRRKIWGPADVLLLLVTTVLALSHVWSLSPFSTSYRQARDIFRLTSLPIGAPSASLRSRTSTLTPHDLGLQSFAAMADHEDPNDGDAIERLLHRLSSMAGRQTYLLLGPVPLLECHYCKQPLDLTLYALVRVLTDYAIHFLALGFLTCSSASMNRIDQGFAPLWRPHPIEASRPVLSASRLNSRHWRGPATVLLSLLVSLESAVTFGLLGWEERQTSWWNHWHHNVFLVRHIFLLILVALIYLYPTTTNPRGSGSLRIATALGATRDALTRTTSNVALVRAGRDAVWQDTPLRSKVVDYYATQDSDVGEEVLAEAARRGVLKPGARTQASGLVLTKVEELARSAPASDTEK
ncbi:hypothetical protein BCV69DRAFT_296395 [Microstroma glucosiphilum]|uniref:Uncharacterized protein n=1 Tax=Pseudomicrostroma glucosiphilum TaxID=1684307 RepID=A0A316UFR7_9BASI|nr:hypothetical protein BCV69DRAFT_296395 [Pseudomicrostroma glucosiphilum]PWN24096.1 hypothetical protein BCV69DRAFT_296395 [Pseudomicrostroma glucosiphilum]